MSTSKRIITWPATITMAVLTAAIPALATLEVGNKGRAVTKLQERLIKKGLLNGAADGKFGQLTLKAVKEFQRKNDLTADGKVGDKTWKKLTGQSDSPEPTLKIGSKDKDSVKLLQNLLGIKEDGIFGQVTKDKVIAFQKDVGIRADGVVGAATWEILKS